MAAVTFSYTGILKSEGNFSDAIPEPSPDANGVYWWDISRPTDNLSPATGAGYFWYNPAEGHLNSLSGYTGETDTHWYYTSNNQDFWRVAKTAPFNGPVPTPGPTGPTVTYGPSHGALPTSTGFTVYNLNFSKMGDREYRISYQQKNAPPYSYTVRIEHIWSNGYIEPKDFTVTTAASGQTINLESGNLYGTGPMAAGTTPQNNTNVTIRFMDFNAKLGTFGATIGQGLVLNTWKYLYNNLNATFTPSSGVPGTIFNFALTGSDDSYASTNTATLTDPSGNVTTFTKNAYGQFMDYVTNVTSIEGNYTVEHPTSVNRGTSTYDNSGPPIVETKSNGGGKPDRYPLIMTNLFNRNRSIYSIGMTHKDTWDLFL
jgi:hypothetical protein